MTDMNFAALGVRGELVAALREQGLTTPTPVQAQAIPELLAGRDAIVQAQTGTGKTLAFVLPLLQRVDPDKPYSQALIITPTRELAIQIYGEVAKLAPALDISSLPVYGGQDVVAQAHRLQGSGAHVIIGTPGRLGDHLRRETIDLSRLSVLVLDEADQMLALGFLDEVESIVRMTPTSRQTLLFSATMPEPVRRMAAAYLRQPADVRVRGRDITLEAIRQTLVETTDRAKQQTLLDLLKRYRPYLAVIFCRTKIRAKKLTEALRAHGLNVDELHGDLTQARREDVMRRFRSGDIRLLVATDVAARGLDVEGVTHVFNYDIPHDADSYIHRIGRTGRAGQRGFAFTLAAPRDSAFVQAIEKGIGTALERKSAAAFREPEQRSERGGPERRNGPGGQQRKQGGLRTAGGRGAANPKPKFGIRKRKERNPR
ncbi:DEAD/DEAH box helicase [Gordoniibacillus kamchatkensis]|uniref:DEAD/DEAH box helicase n=1 Tax=Gordoniibacillus kamchatkensis TaxID=1590651 RepID=A0ABR5AHR0_9BACL|nr:DEAD/DEAH box helicase [Paenibacillus sp. VKM B-2647]KIL39897.1 DEAD/DEAH box helicase [Paenibacillus sp. VKM B-2647]